MVYAANVDIEEKRRELEQLEMRADMLRERSSQMPAFQHTELTAFDKLGVSICWFGALVLIGVHFALVRKVRGTYDGADLMYSSSPLTRMIYSPTFVVAMALTTTFCAYYSIRIRKLYNTQSASNILFLGIIIAIGANLMQFYALWAPAARGVRGMFGS